MIWSSTLPPNHHAAYSEPHSETGQVYQQVRFFGHNSKVRMYFLTLPNLILHYPSTSSFSPARIAPSRWQQNLSSVLSPLGASPFSCSPSCSLHAHHYGECVFTLSSCPTLSLLWGKQVMFMFSPPALSRSVSPISSTSCGPGCSPSHTSPRGSRALPTSTRMPSATPRAAHCR